MDWSPQQVDALVDVRRWIRESTEQIYYIAGYAGTGKTTIAKHLSEDEGIDVMFAAYTGKAAYVMRSKGCVGAKTIHSLIYRPAGESKSDELREIERAMRELEKLDSMSNEDHEKLRQLEARRVASIQANGRKPMFSLNHDSELRDCDLLVVDECSMVDATMGTDLMSFGKKIIVLGDPAQLPPVAAGGFFTERKPNQLLTEIHRHAKESGILRMATDVRETGGFSRLPGHYGADCEVIRPTDPEYLRKLVLDADQILVGKNVTRHAHNARYRELTDRAVGMPVAGDKIVCLRNNHKVGLLNGSLWRVHESRGDVDSMTVDLTISSEEDGGNGIQTASWAHHFMGREQELKAMRWNKLDFDEFDYGYALTVHKAQGSQWDEVVLFDQSGVFGEAARRWLYTGVTRAAKKLTVVV